MTTELLTNLITTFIPFFGTLLVVLAGRKWIPDSAATDWPDKAKRLALEVVAILGMLGVVHSAAQKTTTDQTNKIEAVKALSAVPEEHKEARAKFMGMKP